LDAFQILPKELDITDDVIALEASLLQLLLNRRE
jgi:hypothetical protein